MKKKMKMKRTVLAVLASVTAGALCVTSVALAADKEEVVYVKMDAVGNVNELTVSDHLVNSGALDTIADASDLSGIENVKGEESFEAGADGALTWHAAGNDIYYQGTTQKELPFGIGLTYYLNDQEISPEELAGKSGRVRIRMEYENRCQAGGVNVPFAAVGGMLLSGDHFKNVEVTNGKVIDDGKKLIAVGLAFPGLEESLLPEGKSGGTDFEIPDYIEVSMDAKDFTLTGTMHAVSPSLLDMLELDEMDSADDLEDKLEQITDASDELTEGSTKLLEGMNELKEKSEEFSEGVEQLNDGILRLEEGAAALQSGSSALLSGGAQLKNGAVSLSGGINQLKSGAAQLQSGVNELYANSSVLDDGSGQILSALDQINTALQSISFDTSQMDALVSGSQSAKDGIAQLSAGLAALQAQMGSEGTVGALKAQNAAAVTQLSALVQQVGEAQEGAQALMTMADGLIAKYDDGKHTEAVEPAKAILQQAQGLLAGADQISGALTQAGALLQGNNQAFDTIAGSVGQLSSGASTLLTQYEKLNTAIAQLPGLVNNILGQMAVLQQNIALLDSKYAEFDGGLDQYLGGFEQIAAGYKVLRSGITSAASGAGALADGSSQLYSGLVSLDDGTKTLGEGVQTLQDGGKELGEGTDKLVDGIDELAEGTDTLAEGMETFDSEAVQEINSRVEEDLEPFIDNAKKAADAAKEYEIFTMLAQGSSGKVTFLIETASIG